MNTVQKLQLRIGEMMMSIVEAEAIIEQQAKEIEALKSVMNKEPHQEMLDNRGN